LVGIINCSLSTGIVPDGMKNEQSLLSLNMEKKLIQPTIDPSQYYISSFSELLEEVMYQRLSDYVN